jgi:hypothetical protein
MKLSLCIGVVLQDGLLQPGGRLRLRKSLELNFVCHRFILQDNLVTEIAVSQKAKSGQFVCPNGKNELKGYPSLVQPVAAAQDTTLAKRLWLLSEELTGVRPELQPVVQASSRPSLTPLG